MADHYYLVASLPTLRFGYPPPMDTEDFLATCDQWLITRDMKLLRTVIDHAWGDPAGLPRRGVLSRWVRFEYCLRNELVLIRSRRLGWEAGDHLRVDFPMEPVLPPKVKSAVLDGSPMDAQMALLRLRWDFLDDLELGNAFNLNRLIIYALKLRILDRTARFDAKRGRELLEGIVDKQLRPGPTSGTDHLGQGQPGRR